MVPIKHAKEGKCIIFCAWIRSIADEGVDPSLVEGEPGRVEIGYHGSGVDEVAVVEMMIVFKLPMSASFCKYCLEVNQVKGVQVLS